MAGQLAAVARGGPVSPNNEQPTMLTVREVADYLRMHEMTIYRMARQGAIPACKVGNRWRFNKKRLLEWLVEHEVRHGAE
jgi:excisionase family DNA binding protein